MARVHVRLVPSGHRAVLKSDGVARMLGAQAAAAAARCNAMCDPGFRRSGAEYASDTVQRGYTAGGVVFCKTREAGLDNLKNNTLKKGVGI